MNQTPWESVYFALKLENALLTSIPYLDIFMEGKMLTQSVTSSKVRSCTRDAHGPHMKATHRLVKLT